MLVAPGALMLLTLLGLTGIEQWTATFGSTADARVMLGRIGIALPYAAAAAIGIIFLFAARGALSIRSDASRDGDLPRPISKSSAGSRVTICIVRSERRSPSPPKGRPSVSGPRR